ncbi:hypothetical protein MTO96_010035 [Rhipicephalus appendiculatus]
MSPFGLMCYGNLLCSEPLNQIESLGERRGRSEERLIVPSPHRAAPTVPVKPSENQTDGFDNGSLLDQPSPQSCGSPSEEGPRRKRPETKLIASAASALDPQNWSCTKRGSR